MNEQIQEYLLKTIDGIDKGIENTVGFLSAEIPLYVQELLLWYGVKSFIVSLLCVIIIGVVTYFMIKYSGRGEVDTQYHGGYIYKETLTHNCSGNLDGQAMITIPVYLCVITIISLGVSLDWLQIWIAPRVWLLEYASTLVK